MSEISEAIEKAHEGEHAEFFNKRIALVIAILAPLLSFSETLGKGAQNEARPRTSEPRTFGRSSRPKTSA